MPVGLGGRDGALVGLGGSNGTPPDGMPMGGSTGGLPVG